VVGNKKRVDRKDDRTAIRQTKVHLTLGPAIGGGAIFVAARL
jgi:hypothetical protein